MKNKAPVQNKKIQPKKSLSDQVRDMKKNIEYKISSLRNDIHDIESEIEDLEGEIEQLDNAADMVESAEKLILSHQSMKDVLRNN